MTKECSRLKNCACLPRNELREVEKVTAIYNPNIYVSKCSAIKEKCSLRKFTSHYVASSYFAHGIRLFLGRYHAVGGYRAQISPRSLIRCFHGISFRFVCKFHHMIRDTPCTLSRAVLQTRRRCAIINF